MWDSPVQRNAQRKSCVHPKCQSTFVGIHWKKILRLDQKAPHFYHLFSTSLLCKGAKRNTSLKLSIFYTGSQTVIDETLSRHKDSVLENLLDIKQSQKSN